jgi:hypothetical protein
MPHTRAAEAVGLAEIITPHVGVGMSDTLGRPRRELAPELPRTEHKHQYACGKNAARERETGVQHEEALSQASVGYEGWGF